jgi:hypothetical protein
MHWEMLNCVPPRRQEGRRFLVGEAERHNANDEAVYAAFKAVNGRYWAKYQTVREFDRS